MVEKNKDKSSVHTIDPSAPPALTKQQLEYTNIQFRRMHPHWDLPKALRGGTSAMRAGGDLWLPQEDKESTKQYEARLKRSYLFGAYGDTVVKLVAKPFSEAVSINNLIPELEGMADNVDSAGRDLTQFSRDMLDAAIGNFGLVHVLVEFPQEKKDADGNPIPRSAGDDLKDPLFPYWIMITPDTLVDWGEGKDPAGRPRLEWIKVKIEVVERELNGREKKVTKYYIYTRSGYILYRKEGENYIVESNGMHSYNASNGGGIPLATFYVNRDGFLTGLPPLERLADINLAHYQSMSDQRNILRFSRFALLVAKGFKKDEVGAVAAVGGNVMYRTNNTDASMEYVEHSGKAIAAGESDLTALEERMEVLGLQPLMSKVGNVKATGQAINEAKQQSSIKAWLRSLEMTLEQLFEISATWIGKELPDDFNVDVYSDFSLGLKASEDIEALIKMRTSVPPQLDHESFIKEIQRRGMIDEELTSEQIQSNIANEPYPLSGITGFDIGDD